MKDCKHYFKPCSCLVMYCTDSICIFCGKIRPGDLHPEVKALMEQHQ